MILWVFKNSCLKIKMSLGYFILLMLARRKFPRYNEFGFIFLLGQKLTNHGPQSKPGSLPVFVQPVNKKWILHF